MNSTMSLAELLNASLVTDFNTTELADPDDVIGLMTTAVTSQHSSERTLAERLLLLSKEQRKMAEDTLLIIRYVIFALSLPATICNVVVFLQPEMMSATSVYVIGLSVAQLSYITTNVVGRILAESLDNPMTNYSYLVYSIYVSSYLSLVVRRGSYLVICWMSTERLYAIVRPFNIRQFVLSRYPLVITALSYTFSAIWNVYMLVKTSIQQIKSSRTGKMVNVVLYTDMYKDNPDIADGFGVAAPVIMTYIPLVALIVLNVMTVYSLRRHNKQRLQSSANEEVARQKERQMTVTILVATAFYVVLSLPYAFHNLFMSAFEEYDKRQKYENLYYVMRSCAFTLTLLSCTLDFFCFLALSTNFRKTFFALIGLRGLIGKGGGQCKTADSNKRATATTDDSTKQ